MTNNQINYWRHVEDRRAHKASEEHNRNVLQETIRHDFATEGETYRHNRATERETSQHNRETERYALLQLGETSRHNRAQESLSYATLEETKRANLERESYNRDALLETQRANAAQEFLTERRDDNTARLRELEYREERRANQVSEETRKFQAKVQGWKTIIVGANTLINGIDKLSSDHSLMGKAFGFLTDGVG